MLFPPPSVQLGDCSWLCIAAMHMLLCLTGRTPMALKAQTLQAMKR